MGFLPQCVYYSNFWLSKKVSVVNKAFNFQITGLALIVTGCVIQGVYSNYLDFLGDSFFNTPVLLVVVGCIIFFITFFGCCGAIKEHHCMTLSFSVLLALILVIELGAGIASYAFREQVIKPDYITLFPTLHSNYCKKCTSHSICFNAHCTEASLTWFANLDHFWMISKKYIVWKSEKKCLIFCLIERTPYRADALKRTLFWSHTFLSASLFERTFFESTLYWLSARFIERTFHWAHGSLSALYHERTL